MSPAETCPGCQRAVADVRAPVRACEDAGDGRPPRCAWRSLRQAAGTAAAPDERAAAAPTSDDAPGAGASSDPLAAARRQLEDEKTARRALREQLRTAEAVAAEAQAIRAGLFDELERTRADLARARAAANGSGAAPPVAVAASGGPVLVDPASLGAGPWPPPRAGREAARATPGDAAPPRPAPAPSRRVAASGLLALGVVAGIVLGAGGMTWRRTTGEPALAMRLDERPPASQPLPSTSPGAVGASPARAPAAAPPVREPGAPIASADAPSAATSADLRARLQAALATEGVAGAVEVAAGGEAVTVTDPAANRDARARTDLIIRAVYAGAQLPAPSIEHRGTAPTREERLAAARRRQAVEDPIMALANAHRDDLRSFGAPAASGRAPAADGVAPGEPDGIRPVVLPVGHLTASCNARTEHAALLRRSWVMWGCMRESCCATGAAEHSDECQAYNRSYPLACPSR